MLLESFIVQIFALAYLQIMAMEKIHNYIVMLKTEAEVETNLQMLKNTSSWNPNARFLVFVDWLERDWRAFALFIIAKFWSHTAINVVIFIPTNEKDSLTKVCISNENLLNGDYDLLQIITSFPYDEIYCNVEMNDFIELGECSDAKISPAGINLFPEKVCSNLIFNDKLLIAIFIHRFHRI